MNDPMMIPAIPTTYAGIRFRSRLEARWAATLDQLGIGWEYEPVSFQLSDGSSYLPDLQLTGLDAWLEVKGEHGERLSKAELFAAEHWGRELVLIGRAPGMDGRVSLAGLRGPGLGLSVGFARCPECAQVSVFVLSDLRCRICGEADSGSLLLQRSLRELAVLTLADWRGPINNDEKGSEL